MKRLILITIVAFTCILINAQTTIDLNSTVGGVSEIDSRVTFTDINLDAEPDSILTWAASQAKYARSLDLNKGIFDTLIITGLEIDTNPDTLIVGVGDTLRKAPITDIADVTFTVLNSKNLTIVDASGADSNIFNDSGTAFNLVSENDINITSGGDSIFHYNATDNKLSFGGKQHTDTAEFSFFHDGISELQQVAEYYSILKLKGWYGASSGLQLQSGESGACIIGTESQAMMGFTNPHPGAFDIIYGQTKFNKRNLNADHIFYGDSTGKGDLNPLLTIDGGDDWISAGVSINYAADAQADDDYEIDINGITYLSAGLTVTFIANTANTDGATLEITDVGDVDAILKMHDQALVTGDIEAGQVVVCVFDGTNWQMTSQIAQ